jgi:hypothetical protein
MAMAFRAMLTAFPISATSPLTSAIPWSVVWSPSMIELSLYTEDKLWLLYDGARARLVGKDRQRNWGYKAGEGRVE